MGNPSDYLESCIRELSRLPGIGPKSASRLAFHILSMPKERVIDLSRSMLELKENISFCRICGGISDRDICTVCSDGTRDRGLLCVVEEPRDVLTIEGTGKYNGLYHVLNGLISPLDGIGPDELNISGLLERLRESGVKEIILALNPTVEGDATTLYLTKLLRPIGIKVTRIAHGLPVGADLEYTDTATIVKSIEGRVEV